MALRDGLAGADLGHLATLAPDASDPAIRFRPHDPEWRRYRIVGLADDEQVVERLRQFDAACSPIIHLTDGGWAVSETGDHTPLVHFDLTDIDALVEDVIERLRQQYTHPIAALVIEETEDGFSYSTEYMDE